MTRYEELRITLDNKFNMGGRSYSALTKVTGHEKASTEIYIKVSDTAITIDFWSYNTRVMTAYVPNVDHDECVFKDTYIRINGLYSATTRKHISWWVAWLKNMGVVPCNWNYYTMKQAYMDRDGKDYGVIYF